MTLIKASDKYTEIRHSCNNVYPPPPTPPPTTFNKPHNPAVDNKSIYILL